jgi:hypothetical protein
MRRAILFAVMPALLLSTARPSRAGDIYFTYSVSGASGIHQVGDVVPWSISASVSGSRGISDFSVSVIESRGESMSIIPTAQVPTWIYPTTFVSNFIYPEHKVYGFFTYKNYFQASGGSLGGGASMGASQFVSPTDTKNFPKALDKTGGALSEGTYKLTKTGFHYLNAIHGGGTVWIDSYGNTADVKDNSGIPVGCYVTKTPSPTLGTLSLDFFQDISLNVGRNDSSAENNFCDGADVNRDGRVDYEDLQLLFDQGGANIDVAADLYEGADVTQDEQVNWRDYAVLASQWRRTDANRANLWCHGADFDRSGTVDFRDLAYLAGQWLKPVVPNKP